MQLTSFFCQSTEVVPIKFQLLLEKVQILAPRCKDTVLQEGGLQASNSNCSKTYFFTRNSATFTK